MRAVVLGGGIIGMFVSYHLLKVGFSVTVVDSDQGCRASVHNGGLVVPAFASGPRTGVARLALACMKSVGPLRISPTQLLINHRWFRIALRKGVRGEDRVLGELGKRSLGLYDAFIGEEGVEADVVRGVMGLYVSQEEAKEAAGTLGGRFVSGDEVSGMGFRGFGGGVFFDEGISMNPEKFYRGMRERLLEMGTRIITGEGARLGSIGGRIEYASSGGEKIEGDVYVIAAGAWSRELCRPLGYDPMIIPARGMAITFETGGARVAARPALLEDYGIVVAQHAGGSLRITSFFELVGFKDSFSDSRKEWLLTVATKHLDGFSGLRWIQEGVGYRPCTPDQLPVVGRVPGHENLLIAAGHCRLGLTLAPVTGHLIRAILTGRENAEPLLKNLDPARFTRRT